MNTESSTINSTAISTEFTLNGALATTTAEHSRRTGREHNKVKRSLRSLLKLTIGQIEVATSGRLSTYQTLNNQIAKCYIMTLDEEKEILQSFIEEEVKCQVAEYKKPNKLYLGGWYYRLLDEPILLYVRSGRLNVEEDPCSSSSSIDYENGGVYERDDMRVTVHGIKVSNSKSID